jgi:predicted nucleotidyltransferase
MTRSFFAAPPATGPRRRDTISDMVKTRNQLAVDLTKPAIAKFCRRHGIRRASVFGSALGNQFRPESDVDVLVEFEPGREPGLAFFAMQDELSQILGRKVDLNTPGFLSPYFRDAVLSKAIVLFA